MWTFLSSYFLALQPYRPELCIYMWLLLFNLQLLVFGFINCYFDVSSGVNFLISKFCNLQSTSCAVTALKEFTSYTVGIDNLQVPNQPDELLLSNETMKWNISPKAMLHQLCSTRLSGPTAMVVTRYQIEGVSHTETKHVSRMTVFFVELEQKVKCPGIPGWCREKTKVNQGEANTVEFKTREQCSPFCKYNSKWKQIKEPVPSPISNCFSLRPTLRLEPFQLHWYYHCHRAVRWQSTWHVTKECNWFGERKRKMLNNSHCTVVIGVRKRSSVTFYSGFQCLAVVCICSIVVILVAISCVYMHVCEYACVCNREVYQWRGHQDCKRNSSDKMHGKKRTMLYRLSQGLKWSTVVKRKLRVGFACHVPKRVNEMVEAMKEVGETRFKCRHSRTFANTENTLEHGWVGVDLLPIYYVTSFSGC